MKRNVLKLFLFVCLGLIMAIVFTGARAPFDVPSPPGIPIVIDVKRDECTIKYRKPDNDGGLKIRGYLVEMRVESSGKWIRTNSWIITGLRCTIGNLKEGSRVQFRVSASNDAGMSEPSEPCDYITIRDH